MYTEFVLVGYDKTTDTEINVMKGEVFILRDTQKQKAKHTTQGNMGEHQGQSGGSGSGKKMWGKSPTFCGNMRRNG